MMPNKISLKQDDMAGSEFETLNLADARFTDINLSGATFHDINFSDVDFSAAQIGGATFKHIGLPPGQAARQRPVTFEEMTLNDSVFRQVDLSNVQIIDCNLNGLTIDGILVTELLAAWQKKA